MVPLPRHSKTPSPKPPQDDGEPGSADSPRGWYKPRDGDRTWVSYRASTESPARSYWLTYRTAEDATEHLL